MLLHNYFAREPVNIHTPPTENVNAMMSIQYSSIRPGFQAARFSWQQRGQQRFGREPLHLGQFDRIKRGVRVKPLQRRGLRKIGHSVVLSHCMTRQAV
jgi:hypothetical protein